VGPWHRLENGEFDPPALMPGDRVMLAQQVQHLPGGQNRVVPFPGLDDQGTQCVIANYSDIWGIIK
jgi:hypothetical protein